MAMSDLPQEIVEEVLSRVPLTSLRAVRTTCKSWNTLSKDRSFAEKHIRKSKAATKNKEFLAIMMMDFKVYLMSINLRGIHKDNDDDDNVASSINRKGKLISINDADGVHVSNVFHCSGLLLCVTREKTPRLVVLNPFRGRTRWIEPTHHGYQSWDEWAGVHRDMYALGYEKKKNSRRRHKILRCTEFTLRSIDREIGVERSYSFEIYNFNSDLWKTVHLTRGGDIESFHRGVSLKGNTYWFAGIRSHRVIPDFFLRCFDFTRERFGPRLPLPFQPCLYDTAILSSVRDKQLAALYQRRGTLEIEVWITTKIERNAVSWSKLFLAVSMKRLTYRASCFCVDEEKKVAVIFDNSDIFDNTRNLAYIIGKDGYFKKVDLGESTNGICCPPVCSYVPSLVQIKQAVP